MNTIKVGKQTARISGQDLDRLLTAVFGNVAKAVHRRLVLQLPVIKYGKKWELK